MLKLNDEWKQENGNYKCPFCNIEYVSKGILTHIWRAHTIEGNNHKVAYKKGNVAWNKGLTKFTDERIKKSANTLKNKYVNGELIPSFKNKNHTPETIQKLKENAGGYRKGSGRGKSGYYKNYWCDSSWELAWTIYHIEHDIKFERNDKGFKYLYNNEEHTFFPDYIKDGIYYEIKGWLDEQNVAKINQFPYTIEIIGKRDISKYTNYVISKYGKDFYNLYEDKKYDTHYIKTKLCECGKSIYKQSKRCSDCYSKSIRKVERPKIEQILKDIEEYGYVGTGRKYNVSDNTIRKWIKK